MPKITLRTYTIQYDSRKFKYMYTFYRKKGIWFCTKRIRPNLHIEGINTLCAHFQVYLLDRS